MMKFILKLLLPSAETISKMVADTLAKSINESGRQDAIVKYTKYVADWDKIQSKIVGWLNDGKIDANEQAEIAKAMQPIVEKILEEVKK